MAATTSAPKCAPVHDGCGIDWEYKQIQLLSSTPTLPTYLLPKAIVEMVTDYVDDYEHTGMLDILYELLGRDAVDAAVYEPSGRLILHNDHSKTLYKELLKQYPEKGMPKSLQYGPLVRWRTDPADTMDTMNPIDPADLRQMCFEIRHHPKLVYEFANDHLTNIRITRLLKSTAKMNRWSAEVKNVWKEICSNSKVRTQWLLQQDLDLLSMEGLSRNPRCQEILMQSIHDLPGLLDAFCDSSDVVGDNLNGVFFDLNDTTRTLLPKIQSTANISEAFFNDFFTRPSNKHLRPNCTVLANRYIGVPFIERMFDTLSEERKLANKYRLLQNESLDDTFYTQYPDIFSIEEIIRSGHASGKFLYQHRDKISVRQLMIGSSKFATWLKSRALFSHLYRIETKMIQVPLSATLKGTRETRDVHMVSCQ